MTHLLPEALHTASRGPWATIGALVGFALVIGFGFIVLPPPG